MEYKYELDYQKISKRIREARKYANLTQAELAEHIDISTNAVAKLENNLMNASLSTLINIANTLHVDMDYLLGNELIEKGDQEHLDTVLKSLIHGLSSEEKQFLIHVINGLHLYENLIPSNDLK